MNEIGIDDQIKLEIDALFTKLDEDKNGFISEEELFQAITASSHGKYTKEQCKEIFRAIDSNKDGSVSKEEFSEFLTQQIKQDIVSAEDEMEDLRKRFKELDLDGSGHLDASEI